MAVTARWIDHNGLEALHIITLEDLGGVSAIFTGRRAGASARWNGGLNWSYSVGDEPGSVAHNRRLTLQALGLPPHRAVMAGLVHGNRVVAVTGDEPQGDWPAAAGTRPAGASPTAGAAASPVDQVRLVPDCDALITDRPGLALAVTAADCVPVYLYDPVRRAIGAIHAGWRGTVAGIAGRAAAAMAERYGCRPAEIRAAVGPSIGPCCYEVDDAVAGPLRAHYGEETAGRLLAPGARPGKYMLDLWEANRQDLLNAGLTDVSITGACTSCSVDQLFSHRAEGGTAGRGAALIVLI